MRKQISAWVSGESFNWLSATVIKAGYTYGNKPAWGKFLEALANGDLIIIPKKDQKSP